MHIILIIGIKFQNSDPRNDAQLKADAHVLGLPYRNCRFTFLARLSLLNHPDARL